MVPGGAGVHSLGISAYAVLPTAIVPITSSTTSRERLAGGAGVDGTEGVRFPNWEGGLSAMVSRSCRRR